MSLSDFLPALVRVSLRLDLDLGLEGTRFRWGGCLRLEGLRVGLAFGLGLRAMMVYPVCLM